MRRNIGAWNYIWHNDNIAIHDKAHARGEANNQINYIYFAHVYIIRPDTCLKVQYFGNSEEMVSKSSKRVIVDGHNTRLAAGQVSRHRNATVI